MGKILYYFAYLIFNIYFCIFHHWEIRGKRNRPPNGPVIVVANHISALDPPLLGSIMNRPVHFMAKEELLKNPITKWFLLKIGVIPVKRGKADRKALLSSLKLLKENRVFGIFPEGTRHKPGKLGKAKPGTVLIALKSKSPILPIGIKNINSSKKTLVSIGKAYTLDSYYDRKLTKEEKKEVADIIMKSIENQINKL